LGGVTAARGILPLIVLSEICTSWNSTCTYRSERRIMDNAVYCLCADEHRSNAILTALRGAGFSSEISVLIENHAESRDMSVKEDAARGAKIGSVVGALFALTIPGIGPALAIGPLLGILGGAAAGGVVGGLAGGSGVLGGVSLPKEVEDRLHYGVSDGEILISVHTDDAGKRQKALDIFRSEKADYIYEESKAA
jgi:hypothetical protein